MIPPQAAEILARIRRRQAEQAADIAALADALAEAAASEDPAPEIEEQVEDGSDWLDTGTAAQRFGQSKEKLQRWCRVHRIGERRGGRWVVNVARLRRHLGQDDL
jgi:hypothetical protein